MRPQTFTHGAAKQQPNAPSVEKRRPRMTAPRWKLGERRNGGIEAVFFFFLRLFASFGDGDVVPAAGAALFKMSLTEHI